MTSKVGNKSYGRGCCARKRGDLGRRGGRGQEKKTVVGKGGRGSGDEELEATSLCAYNDDKSYMTSSCFFELSWFFDPQQLALEADFIFSGKIEEYRQM